MNGFRVRHRGRRHLLSAVHLARLLAADRPRERFRTDLLSLFRRVWRHGRDSAWSVAELARLGLVPSGSTQRLGRDLRRQFASGEPVGRYTLKHLGRERDGSVWMLTRQ